MSYGRQVRRNETAIKAATSDKNATSPAVAGCESAVLEKRYDAHAQPKNRSHSSCQNAGILHSARFLFWCRAYLLCSVPCSALGTWWLCWDFFHSRQESIHLGPTIIIVTITSTIALKNVVGCWKGLSRDCTAAQPARSATEGQASA